MTTDRDLDAQLAGAARVSDADLPALPERFLQTLMTADATEPASVVAARQLVTDAHDARTATRPRRRPGRKAVLRVGAAVLAVAAAWTTAVLVTPRDADAPPSAGTPTPQTSAPALETPPADGLALVAAEEATFPLSLDPVPTGLTATFSQRGGTAYYPGPLTFTADWSSDGGRVLIDLFPDDPRQLPEMGWSEQGAPAGTTTVAGRPAEVRAAEGLTTLLWERADGRWTWVLGEGSYADAAALTAVAESIVDRPQPVGLQFGLAPAGWSVGGYEESRSLDLVSETDPTQTPLRVSLQGTVATIDDFFADRVLTGPAEDVTVQGLPARLGLSAPEDGDNWLLVGRLPAGPLFLMLAPPVLTRDQVLQIAEQITYTP